MVGNFHLSIIGGWVCVAMSMAALTGCTKVPADGKPIYVLIDSATVAYDGGVYGSASSHIPDVWAETGAKDLGAYEMPIRIPVLATGDVPMLVSAGIYDNGVISTRAAYPFYKPDTFTIHNAVAGHVYTYHPVYHYFPNTRFALKEDFINTPSFSNMTITSNGYEGNGGVIHMKDTETVVISAQTNPHVINTYREAYVEMNYRMSDSASMYCQVGIAATNASGTSYYTLTALKPTGQWKKVYLNFSNWIGSNQGSSFQVYFSVSKDAEQAADMYVDNVKLLYFD